MDGINIENITFAIGLKNTIAVSVFGSSAIFFMIVIFMGMEFPEVEEMISEKVFKIIFFTPLILMSFSAIYLFVSGFYFFTTLIIVGAGINIIIYQKIYKYRLYEILGLLAKEHGSELFFPLSDIVGKLIEEYPKKYKQKDENRESLRNKIEMHLNLLVADKIAEKWYGFDLKEEDKRGNSMSRHYRRKPGFEFKSKTKKWLGFFSGKFN